MLEASQASSGQRVLFVSKPIVPPFHDGAKCLVRDLASYLREVEPTVLTIRGAPPLDGVRMDAVYPRAGGFAPSLSENARVMARLLFGERADVWHFVFAPNPRSSSAARFARGVRPTKAVQTVASAPRSFASVQRLMFGDRIVALSAWTRDRLVEGGADPKLVRVIPPCVPPVARPPRDQMSRLRSSLQIDEGSDVLVYPGDIELSTGAPLLAAAIPRVLAQRPDATFVFACRRKTERAGLSEARIRAELSPYADRVRFVGEVPNLLVLLACARVVVFPVDDLYGKIDLPMALLESMVLGIPIVALDHGPLRELGAARLVPAGDAAALADACVAVLRDPSLRAELAQKGGELVATRYRPENVASAYEEIYRELRAERPPRARTPA